MVRGFFDKLIEACRSFATLTPEDIEAIVALRETFTSLEGIKEEREAIDALLALAGLPFSTTTTLSDRVDALASRAKAAHERLVGVREEREEIDATLARAGHPAEGAKTLGERVRDLAIRAPAIPGSVNYQPPPVAHEHESPVGVAEEPIETVDEAMNAILSALGPERDAVLEPALDLLSEKARLGEAAHELRRGRVPPVGIAAAAPRPIVIHIHPGATVARIGKA